MLQVLLQICLTLFPGMVLMCFFSQNRPTLSKLDIVVTGVLVWTYLLVSTSILVGMFPPALKVFFDIFAVIGLALLALFLVFKLRRLKSPKLKVTLSKVYITDISLWILILIPTLFNILLIVFHPIAVEWDFLYIYFPLSKSVSLTGGTMFDVYSMTTLTTGVAPVEPIILSFLLHLGVSFGESIYIAIVPVMFYLLTTIVIYELARELMSKTRALLAVLVFSNLPLVSFVFTGFSLYLDIAFVFYIYSALLYLLKAIKYDKPMWYILAGIAVTMVLLTRELSVFIAPMFISLVVSRLFKQKKLQRLFIVIGGMSAFYVLTLWNLFHFPIVALPSFLSRISPVVTLGILLYFCPSPKSKPLKIKNLILFSGALIPFFLFISRTILTLNTLYNVWGAPLGRVNSFILQARGVELATVYPINPLDYLRFDELLLSINLCAPYLIPILFLAGLILISREKRRELLHSYFSLSFILLIVLLATFLFFRFGVTGSNGVRRLYYFAPVFSIIIAQAIWDITRLVRLNSKYATFLTSVYVVLTWYYIWKHKVDPGNVLEVRNGIFLGQADAFDILFFCALFTSLLILFPLAIRRVTYTLDGVRATRIIRWTKRIRPVTIMALVCIFMITITPVLTDIVENTTSLRSYVWPEWENSIPEVIDYYNKNLNDSFVTVGFYVHALKYFANRSIIDLTWHYGIASFEQYLTCKDPTHLLTILSNSNIRYFLFPKERHSQYELFLGLKKIGPILEIVEREPQFILLREFRLFKLYKFIPENEFTNLILYHTNFSDARPVNEYSTLSFEHAFISILAKPSMSAIADDDQTNFWEAAKAKATDSLIIEDDSLTAARGTNSLKITLNITAGANIHHTYVESQNWSSTPFLRFLFYGANTQQHIILTFHSHTWRDYFSYTFRDDFKGWKELHLSFNDLPVTGHPSLDSIEHMEILFGNLAGHGTVTFHLDCVIRHQKEIGVMIDIPKINPTSEQVTIVIKYSALTNGTLCYVNLLDQLTGERMLTYSELLVDSGEWNFLKMKVPSDLFEKNSLIELILSSMEDGHIIDLEYMLVLNL